MIFYVECPTGFFNLRNVASKPAKKKDRHSDPTHMNPMENKRRRKEPTAGELLHIIFEYIARIARGHDVLSLLVLLADMGRELVSADNCTIWMIDRKQGILWTKAATGLDRVTIPIDKGIAGYVAASGEEIIINDPYGDDRFDQDIDRKTGYRTRAIISLPIKDSAGEILGVFQAVNKMTQEGLFTSIDMERLRLASTYTGKELESTILQEEMEATQKEIIFTLAETGEIRSKETGNHVKRVSEYSRLIAVKYGMDEATAELLRVASPMHDIGKIAIPDMILLKPDRLDEKEWIVMKTHADLGYDILKHSERRILQAAAIVAHEHHEKYNGGGYPRGLKGETIHVFGRITAVADVFDALASDRCYKKAWPMEKILDLFQQEKGEQFETKMADIVIDHIDSFIQIKDHFKD